MGGGGVLTNLIIIKEAQTPAYLGAKLQTKIGTAKAIPIFFRETPVISLHLTSLLTLRDSSQRRFSCARRAADTGDPR